MTDDELSTLLKQQASRHPAPESLRAAVRTQMALQAAAREALPPPRWRQLTAQVGVRLRGLHPAVAGVGGLALGVALTVFSLSLAPRLRGEPALPDSIVAGHVRALQVGPLYEVASSDRHQVKPWFQGRIDYAPPVYDDWHDQGLVLLGGRVQSLMGQPTAVLAYQLRRHVIDLYVWPSDRGVAAERLQRRGFNLVHWSDGGMQYWAVSDLDGPELERFGAAWRARAALP